VLYNRILKNASLYRATLVLGFLPQELLGTSMYEYYHHDDILHLAESHKAALQATDRITTQVSLSTDFTFKYPYMCLLTPLPYSWAWLMVHSARPKGYTMRPTEPHRVINTLLFGI
jgi:hypothetical protein